MSRWYRVAYRLGFTPWEDDTETLGGQIDRLLTAEEARREAPYGSALDLGCGTGLWSVELARRGWNVTGIDVVPRATQAARQRALEAGVDVTFIEGDVTALRDAGVGAGFSLLLDVECFNHLNDDQRVAMAREIEAVAADDATLLLLAWTRARRGPLPPGANREHLEAAFPEWRIVDEEPYDGEMPRPMRNAAPRWYRMARA